MSTTGTVTAEKQVQEIWQHHLASFPAFKTLVGSVQVSYNDGKKQSVVTIVISYGKRQGYIGCLLLLGIAKVLITPEKAAFSIV